MLLTAVRDEFSFHCQCRKLSPRTIKNYTKQIDYLLRFLQEEKKTTHIEDVKPRDIKEFLLNMSKAGRTANYVNDLLKAYKVFSIVGHGSASLLAVLGIVAYKRETEKVPVDLAC